MASDFALVFSQSQFQPLFVSFIVTISFVMYRYFKAISLIRILPLYTTLVQKYTKAYTLVFCNRQLMNCRPSFQPCFGSTEKGYRYHFVVMQETKLLSFNTYLCVYSIYRYISHMDHFRRSLVKSCLKCKVNENKCLFAIFLYM